MTVINTSQRPADDVRVPAAAPFRIAVAGCGPKGMYCLERLAYELVRSGQRREIQITIFEPEPFPGAGNVYHPHQPHYLRMNFASEYINAWPDAVRRRKQDDFPTFVEWVSRKHPEYADPQGYAPRAIVGEYLTTAFEKTLQLFPDFVTIEHKSQKVAEIKKTDVCWLLTTDEGQSVFDEVLVAVGHEGWRKAPFKNMDLHSEHTIESAFPVQSMLSPSHIPAQSTVAVRGFALTFIDVCLALTEGRGGTFFQDHQDWNYLPSGNEVQTIVPYSRSGHPTLAKPDTRVFDTRAQLEPIWEQGREWLRNLKQPASGLDFRNTIWPVILKTAETALLTLVPEHEIGIRSPLMGLQDWFRDWSIRRFSPEEALHRLKQSYRVATAQESPDEAWALGEAYRQLYPALIERVSYGGLALTSWHDFKENAREMERLAFGPPAENVGRLLALIDAGIVNFDFLHAKVVSHGNGLLLKTRHQWQGVDRLVNAVIPASDQIKEDGLLDQLLSSSRIRRMLGAGGIIVDDSARPILPEEQTSSGLAIIGRATEGCVLGNDTLNRRLHSYPDQWARSVCEQLDRITFHHSVS